MENDSNIFHQFNSKDELSNYLNRATFDNEENGKYDFEQCVFNFDVVFKSLICEFNDNAIFKNARFKGKCSFENIKFIKQADFNGCTFETICNFKNATFEENLTIGSFQSFANFKHAKFKSDTFWGHYFSEIDFSFCVFEKGLDLSEREFTGKLHLNDSTFNGNVNFMGSTFKNKVNAWETTFNKDLIFKWANFKKKINLTESKIESGNCDFYGVNFEGNGYFYKTIFNKLDLKNSVIEKGVFFLGAEITNLKRETSRIIKNEFVKQNNKIEALKYHAKEMEAFKVELTEDRALKKESYSFWDYWILKLNKYSNNFGLNPGTAIKFTFLVSTTCFFIYYLSLEKYPIAFSLDSTITETFSSLGTIASHYIEFVNPTHKANFIIDYIGTWSIFIDYFSRIFIGFGIYQLIQSFRKYGRL